VNSIFGADWGADVAAAAGWPWTSVSAVDTTGSTNADLVAQARSGAPSGTVLVAAHQSGGRGRLDRTWTAPPGTSLAISALLRPPEQVPIMRWLWLPLLTGLAVVDAVGAATGVAAAVKWPNDVLIDGRKLCGILSERVVDPRGDAAVIGMGINTRLRADQLPVPTATSLALAGVEVDERELVVAVLAALGQWYRRWLDEEDFADAMTQRCSTVGRLVRVELGAGRTAVGTAVGIDSDGRLLVDVDEKLQAFSAGDVVHLR
jgi:BirA family biotin operon repressor/biotin-[acetyl-CoA-carboxylase] ligase